jgi:hypothetical protein
MINLTAISTYTHVNKLNNSKEYYFKQKNFCSNFTKKQL